MSFAARYPDGESSSCDNVSDDEGHGGYTFPGSLRGEIEVFASHKGHVTDWHFDFMENFTFQLQGR